MDIFYTKETLFIDLMENINQKTISKMEKRLFNILESYDIENIVINILNQHDFDQELISGFINNYEAKFRGKLVIN